MTIHARLLAFLILTILFIKAYAEVNIPPIGIIVPLKEESVLFKKAILDPKKKTIEGITYTLGKINHQNVVFVNSGIGKINAAIIATRLIRDFHPRFILMSGSSGSVQPKTKRGSVVIGKNVIDVDLGVLTSSGTKFQFTHYLLNPQKKAILPLVFSLNNNLLEFVQHLNEKNLPKIILGKIASTDALPNPISQIKLLQQSQFDVIEMEGASLMQTCWIFNIPCMVIRGVSNYTEENSTPEDIRLGGDNAAKIAIHIISSYRVLKT